MCSELHSGRYALNMLASIDAQGLSVVALGRRTRRARRGGRRMGDERVEAPFGGIFVVPLGGKERRGGWVGCR